MSIEDAASANLPSPRLRRSPEAARENILSAAETILLQAGPQNLKLAEVAKAAGVANGTVLHYFGSIDGVQTALMTRLIGQLVGQVLDISSRTADPDQMAGQSAIALFDAFEARGAARLAAWLELTGESRRLTLVREAVRDVIQVREGQGAQPPAEMLEDFILVSISIALGVGLFGATLGALLGKPESRARELALGLLHARVRDALSGL